MAFANRGKGAEDAVQTYLKAWAASDPHREFNRMPDAKAAGRIVKAAPADFDYYSAETGENIHGLIEVKETEHEYRLGRDRLTQLPRLRKRNKCGGECFVLVYHTKIKRWRRLTVDYLVNNGDKGSWDLRDVPSFEALAEAFYEQAPRVFPK